MSLFGVSAAALICAFAVSGCSHRDAHSVYVSRPVPDSHVLLVPELQGGWAGWSLATGYRTTTESGGSGGPLRTTSTGPIFAEGGCEGGSETAIDVYALTTSEVVAVSVDGGTPIPTTTNATLTDGLRAAAVEVLRHNGRPSIEPHCPHVTPLNADGKPVARKGKLGRPQAFKLPGTRRWEAPARPPRALRVQRYPAAPGNRRISRGHCHADQALSWAAWPGVYLLRRHRLHLP
jgi:hypothetical protein